MSVRKIKYHRFVRMHIFDVYYKLNMMLDRKTKKFTSIETNKSYEGK